MAKDIVIKGTPQDDGIKYEGMDVIEINLGGGVDEITIQNTSPAIHLLDLGNGDDTVKVKDIDGPFIIHGKGGSDKVKVSSDDSKLELIQGLLAFDGGSEDDATDMLELDNSADLEKDDVLHLTRVLVEVESMKVDDAGESPQNSYLVNLRGATGGEFTLDIYDSVKDRTTSEVISYPFDVSSLESTLQRALIRSNPDDAMLDEENQCGDKLNSKCSNAVKVYEVGDAFAVFFVGERKTDEVILTLNTDGLVGFQPEMFQNATVDILKKNSDVAYANVEVLDIKMGDHDIVVNARGTTATTHIYTQSGDDYVFISSEANQDISNAAEVEVLLGWLDYMEEDLTVEVADGRHRLLMSDKDSNIAKGSDLDGPALLTGESLTNLGNGLGDIYFTTSDGNWSAGVNLWLGQADDQLHVTSVPSNQGSTTLRTTTSVHAGPGNDQINVQLDVDDHDGVVFVANGQDGDDVINAELSSLPVILFGDGGDDQLTGGSADDVVFGDYGRVLWREYDNIFNLDGAEEPNHKEARIVAQAGGGGWGDVTDGIVRNIADIVSSDMPDDGGSDIIELGEGNNVGIGGPFEDELVSGSGIDILVRRFGLLLVWNVPAVRDPPTWHLASSLDDRYMVVSA